MVDHDGEHRRPQCRHVAIVGAGPVGLSVARMFRIYGVDYDQLSDTVVSGHLGHREPG